MGSCNYERYGDVSKGNKGIALSVLIQDTGFLALEINDTEISI